MSDYTCKICERTIQKSSLDYHLKKHHNMMMKDYKIKYYGPVAYECDICKDQFLSIIQVSIHKQKVHGVESARSLNTKRKNESKNIKCEICSYMTCNLKSLSRHLKKLHKVETKDYYKKYMMKYTDFENCKQCGKLNGFRFDRGFNDFCCFSCSTTWYAKNTNRVEQAMNTLKKRKEDNPNYCLTPTQIEYWLNKGLSQEEAMEKQKERQQTFTKDKLIEKYGDEQGIVIWQERQIKWQNTLKNKSPEEIERINRAKMCDNRGFSKISQKLFDSIKSKLNTIVKIYYATNYNDDIVLNGNKGHYEYMLLDEQLSRVFFLDFFIPSINYCIEFDGDYWHGEKRGNQEKDANREKDIKKLYPELTIVHIKERDFKKESDKIVDELVADIHERLKLLYAEDQEV